MSFEEQAAYALASWQRFDSKVTDEVARAITSAFVLVAAGCSVQANGGAAPSGIGMGILSKWT